MHQHPLSGLNPADLPEVLALLEACSLPLAGVADHFEHFVGARSGTKLIGVIGAEHYGGATLLRSLAVDEAARGTGLGGRLVTDFLDRERARGTATVFLLTTTADAFFLRLGFAPVGREEVPEAVKRSAEFLGACPSSARAMAFRLL